MSLGGDELESAVEKHEAIGEGTRDNTHFTFMLILAYIKGVERGGLKHG